jgi:hypothetical protein
MDEVGGVGRDPDLFLHLPQGCIDRSLTGADVTTGQSVHTGSERIAAPAASLQNHDPSALVDPRRPSEDEAVSVLGTMHVSAGLLADDVALLVENVEKFVVIIQWVRPPGHVQLIRPRR